MSTFWFLFGSAGIYPTGISNPFTSDCHYNNLYTLCNSFAHAGDLPNTVTKNRNDPTDH